MSYLSSSPFSFWWSFNIYSKIHFVHLSIQDFLVPYFFLFFPNFLLFIYLFTMISNCFAIKRCCHPCYIGHKMLVMHFKEKLIYLIFFKADQNFLKFNFVFNVSNFGQCLSLSLIRLESCRWAQRRQPDQSQTVPWPPSQSVLSSPGTQDQMFLLW